MDRPQAREVLERHLRGPVLADRDAGVGAAEADVGAADRRHADEVVGPREERREGRGERGPVAPHLEADRRGDHLLLGDVDLDEAVGEGVLEVFGVGRVADLAVEGDDVVAPRAERRQRHAVGFAGRHFLAHLPGRHLAAGDREAVDLGVALGLRHVDVEVALAAQFLDRLGRVLERFAVLAGLVLDLLGALALLRPGDDHRRPVATLRRWRRRPRSPARRGRRSRASFQPAASARPA